MVSKRRATGLAIIIFLIGFSGAAWAEEPLNIENWPGDIPCNLLKKHPDGAYEITVAWNRFFQRHAPGRNTAIRARPASGTRSAKARRSSADRQYIVQNSASKGLTASAG